MAEGKKMARRHSAWWQYLPLLFTIHYALFVTSCTQDVYDKGEGKYSLMRGDFVEAYSNGSKKIAYFVTDESERLALSKAFEAKWISTPDSIYRCIIYYNKVREENGTYVAEPVSIRQVPCLKIKNHDELENGMKTDPVRFESAWLSKSGRYLNLSLYLLTGSSDDENASQMLSVVCDTVVTNPNDTRTMSLRLFHDQGGVPEYYSTQIYTSIATAPIEADSVRITINTYDTEVVKTFSLQP